MKLHDLSPAPGSRKKRTRVGRGIAAGGGKTAGRGTKGQKARAGGSIPPWFEGGQTPLHMRIPKLRGFRNPFKTEYEIVNLGRIAALVELGALEPGELPGSKKSASAAPITVNQEILRAVGAVRTLDKPLKVLGHGEIDAALFVVADAFSRTAVAKIEAAGGSVQVLEVPTTPLASLGIERSDDAPARPAKGAAKASPAKAADVPTAAVGSAEVESADAESATVEAPAAEAPATKAKADKAPAGKTRAAATDAEAADVEPAAAESPTAEPARAPKARATRSKAAAPTDGSAEADTTAEPAESTEAPTGEDA
jgi:large subunit ribosomal protein L15